jgi:hypothetical protein
VALHGTNRSRDAQSLALLLDTRPDESGFLKAFDSNRDLMCAAAAKVHVRGSRGSYDLIAALIFETIACGSVHHAVELRTRIPSSLEPSSE